MKMENRKCFKMKWTVFQSEMIAGRKRKDELCGKKNHYEAPKHQEKKSFVFLSLNVVELCALKIQIKKLDIFKLNRYFCI